MSNWCYAAGPVLLVSVVMTIARKTTQLRRLHDLSTILMALGIYLTACWSYQVAGQVLLAGGAIAFLVLGVLRISRRVAQRE